VPFTPLTSAEIAAGKPTKQEIFQKLLDDLNDLDTRLTTVEGVTNVFPPIVFEVTGPVPPVVVKNALMEYRMPLQANILAVRVFVETAGTAGTLQIDIKKKAPGGTFATVLSAPISAAYTTGNEYLVSGTVSAAAVSVGDIVALDVTGIQTSMSTFHVYIEYEGQ
jgi:hypothetical protein